MPSYQEQTEPWRRAIRDLLGRLRYDDQVVDAIVLHVCVHGDAIGCRWLRRCDRAAVAHEVGRQTALAELAHVIR
jgi:hypothetical protein